jgi:predicted nucleic acid-binding Zn ribbon protein
MSAEPIKYCPRCNGKVKRLIGTGLVPIFKGNGFYQTDYKSSESSKNKPEKKIDSPNKESKPQSAA